MILALIPARSGSKRLPGKNLKLLHGRPLIAYTILEAQKAAYLDQHSKLVVSTEDDEIADVAREYRCDVIKRPLHLAGDKSSVYGTIRHAMDAVGGCEAVCLLQVTSPLRVADDIDRCIEAAGPDYKQAMTVGLGDNEANGAVYVGSSEWLRNGGNWDDGTPIWVAMPKARSVDINTPEEFAEAERLMSVHL